MFPIFSYLENAQIFWEQFAPSGEDGVFESYVSTLVYIKTFHILRSILLYRTQLKNPVLTVIRLDGHNTGVFPSQRQNLYSKNVHKFAVICEVCHLFLICPHDLRILLLLTNAKYMLCTGIHVRKRKCCIKTAQWLLTDCGESGMWRYQWLCANERSSWGSVCVLVEPTSACHLWHQSVCHLNICFFPSREGGRLKRGGAPRAFPDVFGSLSNFYMVWVGISFLSWALYWALLSVSGKAIPPESLSEAVLSVACENRKSWCWEMQVGLQHIPLPPIPASGHMPDQKCIAKKMMFLGKCARVLKITKWRQREIRCGNQGSRTLYWRHRKICRIIYFVV